MSWGTLPNHYPISYYQLEVGAATPYGRYTIISDSTDIDEWSLPHLECSVYNWAVHTPVYFWSFPKCWEIRILIIIFQVKKLERWEMKRLPTMVVNQHRLPRLYPGSANCWLCPFLGIRFLLVHTIAQGPKNIPKLSKLDLDSLRKH